MIDRVSYPIHNKEISKSGKVVAKKRTVSVWVVKEHNDRWMMYHCPDCRNPIAQYKGDLVAEVPGESPMSYPVKIQCKNPKCGRKILFKESIEQVV